MFPSGCFYSPQMQTSNWSNGNEPKAIFDFKYPEEIQWPPRNDCQLSFPSGVTDAYPTDPYPSTSLPISQPFKLDGPYSYSPASFPSAYGSNSTGSFNTTPQFSQFMVLRF